MCWTSPKNVGRNGINVKSQKQRWWKTKKQKVRLQTRKECNKFTSYNHFMRLMPYGLFYVSHHYSLWQILLVSLFFGCYRIIIFCFSFWTSKCVIWILQLGSWTFNYTLLLKAVVDIRWWNVWFCALDYEILGWV